jgi:hypothetical protein
VSTTIRHRRQSRLQLNPWRRHELLTGEVKPAPSYAGYTNGRPTDDLADFISVEMREDWHRNRDELMKFWKSGEYTTPDIFPNSLPWLFVCGRPGTVPWASVHLDGIHDFAER